MNSILFTGILAVLAVAIIIVLGFGFTIAIAQMADNATMGNMTGGKMIVGGGNATGGGNSTDATGSISGIDNNPFG